MKNLILFALVLSASASANDYAKFYKPINREGLQPTSTTEAPEVIPSVGSNKQDVNTMWKRGYSSIGYSNFNGQMRKDADAVSFAKKIGARYVIMYSAHTGTRTGAMTTPLLGSFVTMPLTQERYDQAAVFYGPVPHKGIGVLRSPLTDDQKASIGSNKGFVIVAVRRGSPAYEANLVPGDMVVTVNGHPSDIEDLVDAVKQSTAPVRVGFIRNGHPQEVQLVTPESWR